MQQAGVALHALVLGTEDFGNFTARERAVVLGTGTRETGGQYIQLLTESGVRPALRKLARQLSSQYKVVYSRPESLIPAGEDGGDLAPNGSDDARNAGARTGGRLR